MECATQHVRTFDAGVSEAARSSSANCCGLRGSGPGSLQPRPARSYAQTRVDVAIWGWTAPQSSENAPKPASSTTVGLPCPDAVQVQAVAADIHQLTRGG